MPHPTKIATCCYCGTRAALVLAGRVRHELACSNCGAPLHELKKLPVDTHGDRELVKPSPVRGDRRTSKGHRARRKKPKTRKGLKGFLLAKVADAAEDILDDVFDIFD